jgi:hypothetical protein
VFFLDGVPLGVGLRGFVSMIDKIETTGSGWVFILAPRIKNEDPDPEDQLSDWAMSAGMRERFEKILFGAYGGLVDFGRLMDE